MILLHTCIYIYIHTYVYNNLYISNSHIIYIGVRASVSIKFHPISAIMAWAPGMLVNSFTSIWNLRPLVSKGLRSALMRQSFRLSSRDGPKSMLALAQVSILKSGKRYLFIWNVGDSHRPYSGCQVSTAQYRMDLAMFPSHELQAQWRNSTWWNFAAQLSVNAVMDVRNLKKIRESALYAKLEDTIKTWSSWQTERREIARLSTVSAGDSSLTRNLMVSHAENLSFGKWRDPSSAKQNQDRATACLPAMFEIWQMWCLNLTAMPSARPKVINATVEELEAARSELKARKRVSETEKRWLSLLSLSYCDIYIYDYICIYVQIQLTYVSIIYIYIYDMIWYDMIWYDMIWYIYMYVYLYKFK